MGWLLKITAILQLVKDLVGVFKKKPSEKEDEAKAKFDDSVSRADKSGRP